MPDYSVPAPLISITPAGWKTLPEDLDANFRALHAMTNGAGSSALAAWFFGSGRLVGADFTAARIAMPATPAPAFRIPNATYWINGQEVVVNEPGGALVVIDIPEDAGTYHVYASADQGGELIVDPETGYNLEREDDPTLAYLGTITTDGATVTEVDGAASNYLQNFADLAARLVGSGPGNAPVDLSAIYARLIDLERRVTAIENNEGGDVVAIQTDSEAVHVEVLQMAGYLVEQFPGLGRVLNARFDIPGSTGDREPLPDGPADRAYAGGNAKRSARDKAII